MDGEEMFWVAIWRIIAFTVVAVAALGAGSCQMTNYRISEAIKAGASPIEARCALEAEQGVAGPAICATALLKGE